MATEKTITINDFTGITAFLNGEKGLHDLDQDVHDKFIEEGHVVKILDDLFENPKPLENLRHYSNLVIFTTGLRNEKLTPLVLLFEKSGYVPKNVIFLTEGTALTLCGLARDLKPKGTNFYFIDIMDCKTLYPIVWI